MPGAKMPPPEVEKKFSVQGVWHEKPMGYHVGGNGGKMHGGVWDDKDQRQQIYDYCPEVKMLLDMRFEREKCTEEDRKAKEDAEKESVREKKEKEDKQIMELMKQLEEQQKAKEEEEKKKEEDLVEK